MLDPTIQIHIYKDFIFKEFLIKFNRFFSFRKSHLPSNIKEFKKNQVNAKKNINIYQKRLLRSPIEKI